jgi:hypothetical protein
MPFPPPAGPPAPAPRPWSARCSWGSAAAGLFGILLLYVVVAVLFGALTSAFGSSGLSGLLGFGGFFGPLAVATALTVVERTRWVGVWMFIGIAVWPIVAAGACTVLFLGLASSGSFG